MSVSPRTSETDSYLKRYYKTLPEEKRLMMEKSLMDADNNEQAHTSGPNKDVFSKDPKNEHIKHRKAEESEDNDAKKDQKSSTCVVL